MKKGNYFTMAKLDGQKAKIDIYGEIVSENYRWSDVDTSAVSFRDALAALGDVEELDIHINSPGGDVFEGAAIANMIKRHPATTNSYVDGLSASIASTIAVSADNVYMPENAMLMIHNAWSVFMGNHNELREYADALEKINNSTVKQSYIDKNPDIDVEVLSAMMDKETWLSASEAKELGLIDEVIGAVQVAASITKEQKERFTNIPAALAAEVEPVIETPSSIDKEYLDKAIQQLKDEIADLKKPAEPVKDSSLSAFFLNIN